MGKKIAFIPVRGGSKSIPLKNIKEFHGKPLVYWCTKSLVDSKAFDRVIIFTDSEEIKKVVDQFNFESVEIIERSPESASDQASTEMAMLEFINKEKLNDDDIFCLTQATSPFTKAEDFSAAMKLMDNPKIDSVLSVVQYKRFFWEKKSDDSSEPINYDFTNRPRRQDFEGISMENGAFYINTVGNIVKNQCRLSGKVHTFEMPEYTATELDEPHDWITGEKIMAKYY